MCLVFGASSSSTDDLFLEEACCPTKLLQYVQFITYNKNIQTIKEFV